MKSRVPGESPSEFEDQDGWGGSGPGRRQSGWDDDPFADGEEAEPEYGDFWPEEEDDD